MSYASRLWRHRDPFRPHDEAKPLHEHRETKGRIPDVRGDYIKSLENMRSRLKNAPSRGSGHGPLLM
jgi:hypothetical protein